MHLFIFFQLIQIASSATISPLPAEVLNDLISGNNNYRNDAPTIQRHTRDDISRRTELSILGGQQPKAVVLACSDSRVPVEFIFSQGIGDIFVIRAAGAVPGPDQMGSLEYAVEHLNCQVMIIMAHTRCGAIQSAVEAAENEEKKEKEDDEGYLEILLGRLKPVVNAVRHLETLDEKWAEGVRVSPKIISDVILSKSETLFEMYQAKHFNMYETVYNIKDGTLSDFKAIDYTGPPPKEAEPEKRYELGTGALVGIIIGCIIGGLIIGVVIVFLVVRKAQTPKVESE